MSTLVGLSPAVNLTGEIVPTAPGARFGAGFTVTARFQVAVRPSGSCTISVITVPPAATGLTVMVEFSTETVATPVFADTAV